MKKPMTQLTCTVCKKSEVMEDWKKSDWLEIALEDAMEDRSWNEYHFCPSCRVAIAKAEKKKTGGK